MPYLHEDIPTPENGYYVLVTGANSGLGLGICTRMIDEFLQTRPQTESLVLIITTRDRKKGDATIDILEAHMRKVCRQHERSLPGVTQLLQGRIHFRQERLDLLSLVSVQELSKKLLETTPKLDVVICNAGIGGWTGINWPLAVWSILTKFKTAVTFPTYKLSGKGWVAKPQLPAKGGKAQDEPPLGEVFCANFFGHYLLGHYLSPLLARHPKSEGTRGRIIWTSSLEAYAHTLNMDDLQGIFSEDAAYESSKRLTDVMGITSRLPATSNAVDQYMNLPNEPNVTKPLIYVTHPGITATAIFTLPLVLEYAMIAAFYIARWIGSQWHPLTLEKGAVAMVWLALAKQSTLDTMEEKEGVGKWGSATDAWGQERVERTEVAGWGWGGRLSEYKRQGRDPHAKDLTKEDRENFEVVGRRCWEELELLRCEWEDRLRRAGVAVEMN
ncbi:3-keto-steroid reductase [Didymella heteroderae]|uniref:3-keto-steroid reductase n=1 Tax=Didymella heteroderae TaxID=1769908 RepID=A0A9P4WK57_9PLEO|nr:3-keto-steroid reductase [Didymella heteroderae]